MAGEQVRQMATIGGVPLKYVSLVTLTIQNSALILIMRYSRIMPLVDNHRYFTSTAVLLNEVLKFLVSFSIAMYETSEAMPSAPLVKLATTLTRNALTRDSWKLAIPAVLYTFQNTLQYVAVSNLDAATFQVTYQLKILTTALFSVTMLHRSLSVKKWVSLVLLMVGVATVQFPSGSGNAATSSTGKADEKREVGKDQVAENSATVGLLAVITACAISGLAGVYFEKVLKDGKSNVTLWVRNVQLSFYSLFPALLVGVVIKDGAAIAKDGFFAGYNWIVWTAIAFQAFGGLVVALVVNYADNIAKNFATSISIILSLLASIWFFDFVITINFLIGMVIVLYATYLYSAPEVKPLGTQTASLEESGVRLSKDGQGPDGERTPFMTNDSETDLKPPPSPRRASPP